MKKIPLRTCAVTKEKLPKKELLRIVKTPENTVMVDVTGKVNGRGVYIKKSMEALEKAKKSKALARSLEVEINDDIYNQIEEIINNN